MTFHYTATFENFEFNYHGEVMFKYVKEEDIKGNEDKIILACKRQFVEDCKRWGMSVKDVNSFECYYYTIEPSSENELITTTREVQIMKWEKSK